MATEQTPIAAEQILSSAQIVNALVPAVLIAFATFGASWWATRQAHALDRKQRDDTEAAELTRLLKSLRIEFLTAWDRYQDEVGGELENHTGGGPFTARFRVNHSLFPVYEQSAGRLGALENESLAESIVVAHAYFRSLLDTHARHAEIQDEIGREGTGSARSLLQANMRAPNVSGRLWRLHEMTKMTLENAVRGIESELGDVAGRFDTEEIFRNRQRTPDAEPGDGAQ